MPCRDVQQPYCAPPPPPPPLFRYHPLPPALLACTRLLNPCPHSLARKPLSIPSPSARNDGAQ
eukprot:365071-Chlamydomonas_euryale.AAC.3